MKIANKGIKFRIKPNAQQRELLEQHFGGNRWVWNHFLEERKREYAENKLSSSYYSDSAKLTALKKENNWLFGFSATSQQRTLKNLDDAYKRFFKGHARFPRFKYKKHSQSFTQTCPVGMKGGRLAIPLFREGIKFNRQLPAFDKINNITITKTESGKYYASLSVEAKVKPLKKTRRKIGLDLGLKDFAVLSNGKRFKNPRHTVSAEKKLAKAQQHLSSKKKGSKRREKQRIKVAKIHEQIANVRKDFLHKTSKYIVEKFDIIMVEDLAVKNMVRNHSLAKHISDAGWGTFLHFLEYKSEWYSKKLVKVGRFFPSSKCCSDCGYINQSLKLEHRKWTCTNCDTKHDRDLNAAKNILREGNKISGRQSPITNSEAA